MKGSEFFFDCVQLLYYKCHKINSNRSGSYIESLDWTKNKKATTRLSIKKIISSFNTLNSSFNYEEIKKAPQRIKKIKLFKNKYNWERINFPSEKDDWKKCEKNNVTIALNVLYSLKEKTYPAYVSKYNSNR